MKPGKKIAAYPLDDLFKIEEFIYEFKSAVHKSRYERKTRSKAVTLALNTFVKQEVRVLPSTVDTKIAAYDLDTLEYHCLSIDQKNLLIKKIRSQADVYIFYNASLLRHLLYNMAGLALCSVVVELYQRIGMGTEPGTGLFQLLFKGISFYLGVSILYLGLKAYVNTIISKHELSFWKKVTVGLLDEKEYVYNVIAPLSGLKKSLYVVYPSVLMIYLILFYYSYKFPQLFNP